MVAWGARSPRIPRPGPPELTLGATDGKPLIVPLIFLRSRHELDTKRLMVEIN